MASKDNTALIVLLGIVGFYLLRSTIQTSIVQAGSAAGTTAGASAVNTAVGDIGTIAQDVAHAFGN